MSQTIDAPVMLLDYFELSDFFISLLIVMIFGVVLYSWKLMLILLTFSLGIGPYIKRRNNRGVYWHWPYKYLHISLPGLVNPGGERRFSD